MGINAQPTRSIFAAVALTVIVAALFLSSVPAGAAGASVLVSPGSAPAGGSVSFSGSGFLPGESITVEFGGSVVATATADVSGNWNASGRIASDMPVGSHPMDFNGNQGSWSGREYTVTAAPTTTTVAPTTTTAAPTTTTTAPTTTTAAPTTTTTSASATKTTTTSATASKAKSAPATKTTTAQRTTSNSATKSGAQTATTLAKASNLKPSDTDTATTVETGTRSKPVSAPLDGTPQQAKAAEFEAGGDADSLEGGQQDGEPELLKLDEDPTGSANRDSDSEQKQPEARGSNPVDLEDAKLVSQQTPAGSTSRSLVLALLSLALFGGSVALTASALRRR